MPTQESSIEKQGGLMHSKLKLTVVLVSFLAFFLFSLGCREKVSAGPTAPDFSLPDLSGNMTSLAQYRGSVVLLDFWATWCPPCKMSIPELVKLQKKYREKGLVILGISLDDPGRASDKYLRAFKEKYSINYTILRFNRQVVLDYFGFEAPAIPTMFLIDREGKIRGKFVGFMPGALEKALEGVLG
jgi:cytochrome c biogenesis protein CcmG/thiol:disulfide interchange protein DsbE